MSCPRVEWNPLVVTMAAGVVAVAALSGCSSSPPDAGSAVGRGVSLGAATNSSEAERVHAYLEDVYPAAAVKHSFRTTLGQTVDCVDFFAMPGVRAMAARGEPITEMPAPPPPQPRRLRNGTTVVDPPAPPPVSEGLDEDGNDRICPAGTVLQIRVTPEQIARAGSLDAYKRSRQKHAPARVPPHASSHVSATQGAPPTMWPCESGEFHQYAHVIGDVMDNTPGVVFGMDTMAVYAPAVPQEDGDHDVGQIWMFGGTYAQDLATDPPCTPDMDCVQTIEIGWEVQAGEAGAHVITFSTTDGYTAGGIGCFNGQSGSSCPPFIWTSGYTPAVTPGAAIAANGPQQANPSVASTLPTEMTALVIQIGGEYWVQIGLNGSAYYVGYYPGSNFSKPLATFQVGGEVYDSNNNFTNPGVPMGDGVTPYYGYGWSAYHHDFSATAYANGQSTNSWDATMCASTPPDYSEPLYQYDTVAPPGASSWDLGGYFYYGGTPEACSRVACPANACGTTVANGCGGTMSCGTCASGHSCVNSACECNTRCPLGELQNAITCACIRRIVIE